MNIPLIAFAFLCLSHVFWVGRGVADEFHASSSFFLGNAFVPGLILGLEFLF